MNPGPVDQVVAIFVYSRHLECADCSQPDTNRTELYIECLVRKVTTHGAWNIGEGVFDVENDLGGLLSKPERRYVEAICAPVDTVLVRKGYRYRKTRLADSLGGFALTVGSDGYNPGGQLAHPALFTLPNDSELTPDRDETQEAIECVCQQLADQDLPLDIFNDFGIYCPEVP